MISSRRGWLVLDSEGPLVWANVIDAGAQATYREYSMPSRVRFGDKQAAMAYTIRWNQNTTLGNTIRGRNCL